MRDLLEEYTMQIVGACMVINVLFASLAAYESHWGAMAFNLAVYIYNAVTFFRAGRKRGLFT